jgi:hypothetical protein
MKVTQEMLLLKHYSRGALPGDNPHLIGNPDRALFNRNERYEVVSMIQSIVDELGRTSEIDVQRIERLISDDLPSDIRGREKVKGWLIDQLQKKRLDFRDILRNLK